MHRFIVSADLMPGLMPGQTVALDPDEARHASRVLRLAEGDRVGVFDGNGTAATGRITSVSPAGVLVAITELAEPNEPRVDITLYQGLCKGDKLEIITQKCVELGVMRIAPVCFKRSDVRINENKASEGARAQRLAKIAREAAKQCGRAYVPAIAEPVTFDEMLRDIASGASNRAGECVQPRRVIVPWEKETRGMRDALTNVGECGAFSIVIGPEGGIEEDEIAALMHVGAITVSLGRRVLRTETAAIAAVAALMFFRGEM